MQLSFRWYGDDDPVTLEKIRQIPGMVGIVTAIYDIPAGEEWPYDKIVALKEKVEAAGLKISAIESVPVPEEIKLGIEPRDLYIDNYKKTIKNLAKAGIEVVTYNFMPVFDWTRSELDYELEDGSQALIYNEEEVKKMDPLSGELDLPGWDTSYETDELNKLMKAYHEINEEKLWENLKYFLDEIIPIAEEENIKMAIHPDDPPWSIFGLPRIIVGKENLR
ncbi:MAG: mannonate dehydratase, partial [Halanaerobium sp. MSAO_Bac5]